MQRPSGPTAGERTIPRRGLLSAAAVAGAVALAGCGLLDDEIERSASPAGIDDGIREETQFQHQGTDELTLIRTVTVGGESRDLRLTNHLATYRKTVPAADGGIAAITFFSTPSVSVGGREANPLASLDERQLLSEVASREGTGGFQDVRETGTRDVRVLGASRTVRIHEATRQLQGREVVVRLPVSKLTHDGDLLVIVASYPKMLAESTGVYAAVEGTVHPVEE